MKNKVIIEVVGKNVIRFIKKLYEHKIDLLNITYVDYRTVQILIYFEDYEKVCKLKSIYEVNIVDYKGYKKVEKTIKKNIVFITMLLLGLVMLYLLSNTIFSIEIVHTNKELAKLLMNELENNGLSKYQYRKTFAEIEIIKDNILFNNRDKIEWLEIIREGTRYIVKVEMRKKEDKIVTYNKQHVIAKKNAVIKKVVAKNGEIIRNVNDYVHKGDIIISGNVSLNEEIKGTVQADGMVYGEVWYQTTVEYPYVYYEEKKTGNKKTFYAIKLLNYQFNFFDFKPYKNKHENEEILLKHFVIPFSFIKETQEEIEIIDENLTTDEAINKAEQLAYQKMIDNLKKDEYIINQKSLKINAKDSKIVLDSFFTVYENITDYMEIETEN